MLGRLPGFKFVVTPEAVAEIGRPDQKEQVEGALRVGVFPLEQLPDPGALALFADLRNQMGTGEAASLALAASQGWAIASDERRTFRREAVARLGQGRIMTTPGLYVVAIRFGLLSVTEAVADKTRLGVHRFKMDFSSFEDLISRRPGNPWR
jgi:predicted nucleic acid-binding protein